MKFSIICSLLGLSLLIISFSCWCLFPRKQKLWQIIPRERRLGISLGTFCLIWSAYHAHISFAWMKLSYLIIIVFTVTILAYNLLDYLLSRALGGFLLLTLNWVLHEAFVLHTSFRPLLSAVCYLLGIVGFILIAAPYRFRDLLQKVSHCRRSRIVASILLGLTGFLFCFVSAANYVR